VLDLLDPRDTAIALGVFRRAAPGWNNSASSAANTHQQPAQSASEPEAVHVCNALLVDLAKSNTNNDLDKVGGVYRGTF
jgi:hypothetical protein